MLGCKQSVGCVANAQFKSQVTALIKPYYYSDEIIHQCLGFWSHSPNINLGIEYDFTHLIWCNITLGSDAL